MTDKAWPTLDEVRQQLWDTTQKLYKRIGFLEGTLFGVRDQISKFKSHPDVAQLIATIDSALKEPK